MVLFVRSGGGGAAAAATSCGASASCTATAHTVTLVNQCDFPLWVANAANVVGGSVMGGKACTTTSDCCTTLASGTVDCTGVNCANGYCSQINCTADSQCPQSPSLTSCNVPLGVQCSGDADCATYGCKQNSDCPPNATCNGTVCTGMCQSNVCACSTTGAGCPRAGTVCDAAAGSNFGFCGGGACQYDGLVPQNSQWQLAATCTSNSQCASGQTCQSGLCSCGGAADCTAIGGSCTGGFCVGQTATVCMPQGWGGRYWARTGCTLSNGQLSCQTGQCGQGASAALECTDLADGAAVTATGITLFEGTWDSNGTDFWDVSLVNGYNVGMQVNACTASGGAASCTFAGGSSSATGVGCVADLNPSCPGLLAIAGAPNCVTSADCPSGATCGANNLCSSGSATVTCIDPGDLCKSFGLFGNNPVIPAPACLQCNSVVNSTVNPNATYNDFYNCVGDLATLSCNNAALVCFSDADCPYSGQTCQNQICQPINTSLNPLALCSGGNCSTKVNYVADYGCQTVGSQSLCLPDAPSSSFEGCCGPSNSLWQTAAQAAAGTSTTTGCQAGADDYTTAFKAACPTAYAYQFDDPSSSFQCSSASAPVNYEVVFCPGSSPGK